MRYRLRTLVIVLLLGPLALLAIVAVGQDQANEVPLHKSAATVLGWIGFAALVGLLTERCRVGQMRYRLRTLLILLALLPPVLGVGWRAAQSAPLGETFAVLLCFALLCLGFGLIWRGLRLIFGTPDGST